jgi:hypothetical protein
VSKVDLGEGEGFQGRVRQPDSRLDFLFEELLHKHAEEWPGLLQYLVTQRNRWT